MVENAFLHFDGKRYELLEWVVMPNHVHVLVEIDPQYQLPKIVHSWKSFTGKEATKILSTAGHYWQSDYFDRFIRADQHYANAVRYINENPVKAKLVSRPEDWPYGSAGVESRRVADPKRSRPAGSVRFSRRLRPGRPRSQITSNSSDQLRPR